MVIVDTTVWIDYLQGIRNPETDWVHAELDRQRLGLTDLILCEVLQGVRDEITAKDLERQLLKLEVFETGGVALAVEAARNHRTLRNRGRTVRRTIDCLIATFCIRPSTTDYDVDSHMPWSSIVGDSPRFSWVRPVALLLACALAQSCSQPSQINVAVVFANTWAFEAVDETEEAAVKRLALGTLREAFEGFSVRFRETRSGDRIIRIEDTPYASDPRQMVTFGAAGVTYPASKVSSVRIDVLFNAELAAVHCSHISDCSKSRSELFAGLGRGVGATAAHELGHQAGFGFSRDSSCAECYDGKSSTNDVHFFGVKYWSHEALQNMKGVLPRDAVSGALPE